MPDPDLPIRLATFAALDRLIRLHGPVLPWSAISEGFEHQGEVVYFANRARGIHRPRQMVRGALSIKTTVPRAGREARYDDQVASGAGHFVYKLQGSSLDDWDNQWLKAASDLGAPLVYFYGVAPGLYRPLWPVYITSWRPSSLECLVSVDQAVLAEGEEEDESVLIRRRYSTVQAKARLHQDTFRTLVLGAYKTRCAVCNLPRAELLDAAHIIPDRDQRGRPEVPNGLALCQLHHRAYDRNIIGISPGYIVAVTPSIMAERDGPVLEHGIKGFAGKRLRLPARRADRPKPEYLEERYEEFRRAG